MSGLSGGSEDGVGAIQQRGEAQEIALRPAHITTRNAEIRLELTYIPSPYKEETVNFTVVIGGQ